MVGLIRPKQTGPDAPTTQEMHTGAQMKAPEDQPSSPPSFLASAGRLSQPLLWERLPGDSSESYMISWDSRHGRNDHDANLVTCSMGRTDNCGRPEVGVAPVQVETPWRWWQ